MIKKVSFLLAAGFVTAAILGQAEAAPLKLRFGVADAANSPLVKEMYTPWAKRVSDASGGEVEVQVVPGGTLGNFSVIYDRVAANVANLGAVLTNYNTGQFRKTGVFSIPFEVDSAEVASTAFWRLYEGGVISDEYSKVVPLFAMGFPPQRMLSRVAVHKPGDLKGLKIGVAGKMRSDAAELLGAAPVSMRINELYQALSTGVIDASFNPYYAILQFHTDEVASHLFEGSFGASTMIVIMNKDVWDKLSDKSKKAFLDNSGEKFSREWGKWIDGKDAFIRKKLESKPGFSVVAPTEAERAQWHDLLKPLAAKWVQDTPDGQKVLDALRRIVKQVADGK